MLQDMNFIRTGCRLFRSFVRVIMSGVELRNAVLGILNEDSGVLNRVLMRDGAHFLYRVMLMKKIYDTEQR
jgi:hypothetical protein